MSLKISTPLLSLSDPRRIINGSDQQEAIWSSIINNDAHLEVVGRAGCAKSSTCREAMFRIRDHNRQAVTSYVAFNKSIADDFNVGLPYGASATTMHSAGNRAIRSANPKVVFNDRKIWDVAASYWPGYRPLDKFARKQAVKLANLCKSNLLGSFPSFKTDFRDIERLCGTYGIDCRGEFGPIHCLVNNILVGCFERDYEIDYSDMTWFPVVKELDFDPVDDLFIDESQDLDPCQHALVKRIAGDGRLTVVGDDRQAIYAFRGADSSSMATLTDSLSLTARGIDRHALTKTRRCPSSHVELASRIVGDFEALPDAPDGLVALNADPMEVLVPGTMGLCRNNAPLLRTAFALVARGVKVGVQGRDIGEGLARFVDEFEAIDLADLGRKVGEYRIREIDKLSQLENTETAIESINDRCNCITTVSNHCDTPSGVAQAIRATFTDPVSANLPSMVHLSSVHRAKGRESNRVVIIEPELMPSRAAKTKESILQEMNLLYVAMTRSKSDLFLCGPLPDPLQD